MIRLLAGIFLILGLSPALAQKDIDVRRNKAAQLLYIPANMETGPFRYVRTLQGSAKINEDLYNLYKLLKAEAIRLGANSFKIRSFVKNDSLKTSTLTIAVYFADDIQRAVISNNQETNCLFLFSDDLNKKKPSSFELNGEKIIVAPGYYYKHVITEGQEIKIKKGGFTGDVFKTKYEPEGPSRFLTVEGFKMSSVPMVPIFVPGMIVVPIPVHSTGRLRELDYNFGFLLTELFPVQKEYTFTRE